MPRRGGGRWIRAVAVGVLLAAAAALAMAPRGAEAGRRDPYAVLGVPRGATQAEIKKGVPEAVAAVPPGQEQGGGRERTVRGGCGGVRDPRGREKAAAVRRGWVLGGGGRRPGIQPI